MAKQNVRKRILQPGIACFVLLAVMLLPTFKLPYVVGEDQTVEPSTSSNEAKISTDKGTYAVGDTVVFTVSGFTIDKNYEIVISRKIEGEESEEFVASLEFTFASDGMKVEWKIPFDAQNGTYVAKVGADEGGGEPLASTEFLVESGVGERVNVLMDELEGLEELVSSSGFETTDYLLASLSNCIKKVEAAMELFDEGNSHAAANQLRAARNMLTAFVHKVLAQTGKSIDEEKAAELIGKATEYIEYLDSMIDSTLIPLGKRLALNFEKTLTKQEMHMARFTIRKGLNESITDEELLSFIESFETELDSKLGRANGKRQLILGLLENGTVDYQSLVMELEEGNDSVNLVKAVAELLYGELEELNQSRPGLGKRLGQYMKIAKVLVANSTDAASGMGELMSKAKSHGHEGKGNGDDKGHGKGKGGDDKGHGKGKGGDDKEHGKGKGSDVGDKGNSEDKGKGKDDGKGGKQEHRRANKGRGR